MANMLDIIPSEFELQSRYYVHFWWKNMNLIIFSAVG